jgi:hypothetical protein
MAIESDFLTYLLDQEAIVDVVGNRIFPNQVPQTTSGASMADDYPAIVIPVTGQQWQWTQDGTTHETKIVFSIVCMGYGEPQAAYDSALNLAYTIRNTLNNYSGYWGSTQVIDCSVVDRADGTFLWQQGYANGIQPITLTTEVWFIDPTN